jgi:hypothetical protein
LGASNYHDPEREREVCFDKSTTLMVVDEVSDDCTLMKKLFKQYLGRL